MTRRSIRQYSSLLSLLVVLLVLAAQHFGWFTAAKQQAVQNDPSLYSINHYVDGDTIAVNMNGQEQTVRFIGVDTPETHKPNTPVQCYGELAAAYTKNQISAQGGKVRLQADPESDNRDVYGRLVRYVYLPSGQLLDELLIQNGYGFAYTYYPFTKSNAFVSDQAGAQNTQKGLWTACHPYQESSGRWQTETAS
ncbi:MAG TPA: thermonuclease family protein [Candidatus Saccharimonadales bacterium]|nr:thermonuclease family protein [Candidatus Saccharimonadales bacterium]